MNMKLQGYGTTRRSFLRSGTALAAGAAALHGSGRPAGALALNGGAKAVTLPDDQHAAAYRWPLYGKEEESIVLDILHTPAGGVYRELGLLEKDWKAYYKAPYAKTHCNGTSALASMFFALDLPAGSEILVPSYTFFATIVPMRLFGYVPVFVDVNPRTMNFDLEDAKKRLTKRTRAVLPVHFWGLPCDMDAICDWAKEKGLIVLEDAAHAHGTYLAGKALGTWGEMSIFSFQATKPLPALEGGMGMYKTQEYYERAAAFGHYKSPATFPKDSPYSKYTGTGLGLKLRMHPLAAALARVQLRKLDKRNADGNAQVRRLNDRLTRLEGLSEPICRKDCRRLYYDLNMLFLDQKKAGMSRSTVLAALRAEGVRAHPGNYPLQHKKALYADDKYWHHPPVIPEVLPGSDEANRTSIRLPYFTREVPELLDQYVSAFEKVWANRQTLGQA